MDSRADLHCPCRTPHSCHVTQSQECEALLCTGPTQGSVVPGVRATTGSPLQVFPSAAGSKTPQMSWLKPETHPVTALEARSPKLDPSAEPKVEVGLIPLETSWPVCPSPFEAFGGSPCSLLVAARVGPPLHHRTGFSSVPPVLPPSDPAADTA